MGQTTAPITAAGLGASTGAYMLISSTLHSKFSPTSHAQLSPWQVRCYDPSPYFSSQGLHCKSSSGVCHKHHTTSFSTLASPTPRSAGLYDPGDRVAYTASQTCCRALSLLWTPFRAGHLSCHPIYGLEQCPYIWNVCLQNPKISNWHSDSFSIVTEAKCNHFSFALDRMS